MTDTVVEGPVGIDEARRAKRDVEKRISEILRNFQRVYGVSITGVESDSTEYSKHGVVVSGIRLQVEL